MLEGNFHFGPAAVRRAEPGARQVLAGARRADRQRGSAAADGGGEPGARGPAGRGNRAAQATVVAPRVRSDRLPLVSMARGRNRTIAFSSEVATGSRKENASKQKSRDSVLI